MSTSTTSGGKANPTSAQPGAQQAGGSQIGAAQSGSSGSKNKPVVLITAADSFSGASLVNHLADFGSQRFGKIILCVDKNSAINDKLDASKLSNIEVQKLDMKNPDMAMIQKCMTNVDMVALIPPKDDSKFVASRAMLKAADNCKVNACMLLSWTGTNAIDSAQGDFTMLKEIKKLEDEFNTQYSGIACKTTIRANFFLQNLVTYAKQICEQGQLPVPTGQGKFAPLDAEVLGLTMAKLIAQNDAANHKGQTYTLTGTEAMDADGIAAQLSKAMGSNVVAKQISMDEARELLSKAKPPLAKSEIDTIIETYTLVKQGRMDQVSSDLVKQLDVQHPPMVESLKRDLPMLKKVASL